MVLKRVSRDKEVLFLRKWILHGLCIIRANQLARDKGAVICRGNSQSATTILFGIHYCKCLIEEMKDFSTIFINTSILYAKQYPLCRYHYRRAHPYKDLFST